MRRGRVIKDQTIDVPGKHKADLKTAELCRKHGISDATVYDRKARYGGMTVSVATRSRTLQEKRRAAANNKHVSGEQTRKPPHA
jgi:putative transposase